MISYFSEVTIKCHKWEAQLNSSCISTELLINAFKFSNVWISDGFQMVIPFFPSSCSTDMYA